MNQLTINDVYEHCARQAKGLKYGTLHQQEHELVKSVIEAYWNLQRENKQLKDELSVFTDIVTDNQEILENAVVQSLSIENMHLQEELDIMQDRYIKLRNYVQKLRG